MLKVAALPWLCGVLLLLVATSLVALGADDPIASLTLSGLILGVAAFGVAARAVAVPPYSAGVVAFTLILVALGWARGWLSTGAAEYASLLAAFALFFAARAFARKRHFAQLGFDALLLVGGVVGVAAFFDTIADPSHVFGLPRQDWSNRLSTPFLSPNTAGTFFGLLAVLAIARTINGLEGRGRYLLASTLLPLSVAAIAIICLLMTGSRGAMIAFAPVIVGMGVWAALQSRRSGAVASPRINLPLAIGFVAAAVVGGVWVAGDLLGDRFGGGLAGAGGNARAVMFDAYLRALEIAPLLGHGLGGFGFVNEMIADASNARTLMFQNAAHSVYFQWLLQAGLVGAMGLVLATLPIVTELVQGMRRRRTQRALILAGLAGLVFTGSHGAVDFALEIPGFLWFFSVAVGLSAGVASGGSRMKPGLKSVWWAVGGALVFLAGSVLSMTAAIDRSEARIIRNLDRSELELRFAEAKSLRGSPEKLVAIGDAALEHGSHSLARAAFERAVAGEPRDGAVWAKLSYARLLDAPLETGPIIDALRQSYFRSPYLDERFRQWRYDHARRIWAILPDDVRAAAERELTPFG